ncbi:unnamed protein product [Adineta steineri]|uniref:Uncharacterized protein n=1 Tax=Adineta steineri TaxID=433720 RepID=A0A815RSW3_9BILA|nr:unnamed protein product [Adineta steineri]
MQRVCFCKTVSLFNHVLQPSQAIALFYQSLVFSLKNLALIRWISSTIDIPTDDVEQQQTDTISILKWISRVVLRSASDCSISSKSDRSINFEFFNDFLTQFHTCTNDDLDDEDISRRAIHRALMVHIV